VRHCDFVNETNLIELAALNAIGALDGKDAANFARLLEESEAARQEAARFAPVTEALALALPVATGPSADLKSRILQEVHRRQAKAGVEKMLQQLVPKSESGMSFIPGLGDTGWLPLPMPGAYVKILSYAPASEHAIILGKLDAGAKFPGHFHERSEDLFLVSGDLHVGERVMHAGDFHHAEAGSEHGINWTETGCVVLTVVAKDDLLNQLTAA